MQSDNNNPSGKKVLDDLARDFTKVMGNAAGVAMGATREAEQWIKAQVEQMLSRMNVVTRQEFDVVRSMAQKAREENTALVKRIAFLEGKRSTAKAAPAKKKATSVKLKPAKKASGKKRKK